MIHILCGLPGSGKTIATHYLAAKLNAEVINTDLVHKLLYPKGAHTLTGDFTPESLEEVYRSLRLLAYFLTKTAPQKHIIFEGSFRLDNQRQSIISILTELTAKYSIIYLEVSDDQIVKQRLEERLKTGHAGDFQHYLDIKQLYQKPSQAFIIQNNTTLQNLYSQLEEYIVKVVKQITISE